MPTLLETQPTTAEPQRKRWTRAEFDRIYDDLPEERLELVDGDVISKMGKNRPHVIVQNLLYAWLVLTFGAKFVNSEAPIDVAPEDNRLNEPQPDIILLKRPQAEILYGNPQPADVHLVVEVSDTSLAFDLTTKARLYARAGILEYWVLDVNGRRLIVHRDPRGGAYGSVSSYREDESVAPLARQSAVLQVSEVLL